jgi:urease accessory protein
VKKGRGVDAIVDLILSAWKASGASQARKPKFEPTLMEENPVGKERSYSMS